ncbi:hypothetical protein, partial [Streptomyces sp. IBSBF 3136]|uniref:hypothetical protein n=1 Tax=Streptomyces sp. IBSBF 3136 TaxID=2903524 RepID=UPI002FDC1FC7
MLFARGDVRVLTVTGTCLCWEDLSGRRRELLAGLRRQPIVTSVADDAGAGVLLRHTGCGPAAGEKAGEKAGERAGEKAGERAG